MNSIEKENIPLFNNFRCKTEGNNQFFFENCHAISIQKCLEIRIVELELHLAKGICKALRNDELYIEAVQNTTFGL